MGMRHAIHVLARLADGTYRPIDAIDIPSGVPESPHLDIARHILSLFQANKDLIQLDLARAETLPDHVWTRDARAEAWDCKEELEAARKRLESGEGTRADVKCLKRKVAQLRKEAREAGVPQFAAVRMCLILGVLTHRHSTFLHGIGFRPWNSPPDWGGRYMWETGCTILNLTDGSFAYVVPGRPVCGSASKRTYNALKLRPLSGEQFLKAFGRGDEYDGPVRARDNDAPAPVMPMTVIQAAWPSFPRPSEDDLDEEDDDGGNNGGNDDGDKLDNDMITDSSCDKCIFRDESQHTNPEADDDDERRAPIDEEQRRKRDLRLRELLLNYTKSKLVSHKFDKHFPAIVDGFIREHSEEFTPERPGTVPLLLTALRYRAYERCLVVWLDLSRYHNLPGETVVELVRTVVGGNRAFLAARRKKGGEGEPAAVPLSMLDVSFNHNVTADHMARILDLTPLVRLRLWDNNPDLAAVSDGRITQLTSRERFLEPLRRVVEQANKMWQRRDAPMRSWPAPPMGPGPARIRQVVWTTLKTIGRGDSFSSYNSATASDLRDWMQLPGPGSVSLAQLDTDKLAWILHPRFRSTVNDASHEVPIFGETVALPLDEVWAPRWEVYTSLVRFKEYMTSWLMSRYGHDLLEERWPLKLALLLATGREYNENTITSPFPAKLFDLTWHESVGNGSLDKRLRLHGFDAIVPGESTLVFLHEPDLGLVHYGLVTRAPGGQLEVRDPAAVAREAGDDPAARTWERAFPAAQAQISYRLLDAAAVEKLEAASTRLAQKKNRIIYFLKRFLQDRKEEAERAATTAAAEAERQAPATPEKREDAEVKGEFGCKRVKSEEPEDHEGEPRAKRFKTESTEQGRPGEREL
ncbi:hypothetical protein F4859DRAFT_286880 [Xylaria cf. heliscus]|nr:hypothetical protein F4859DRAFT_286880 [Xylaria cf. heliscus]